jgi:polar amino acid transport system substrate-binding protein
MMVKRLILLIAGSIAALVASAGAQDAPRLSDPNTRVARPDLAGLPRLRFLTTLDFPPFNFADAYGRAAGLNIDLARAICSELNIEEKCEIQAMPWEELDATLGGMRGEAIVAGHRITSELRAARDLSSPYFKFPARFAARADFEYPPSGMSAAVAGKKVAVVARSAHAAMLASWFPEADAVAVPGMEEAYSRLQAGEVDLMFGDGVAMSFWLTSDAADNCCRFVSGPYLSDHFLGLGMTIVMRRGSADLTDAINSALKAIDDNGTYREIYARYFPLSPFSTPPAAASSSAREPRKGQAQRPDETG